MDDYKAHYKYIIKQLVLTRHNLSSKLFSHVNKNAKKNKKKTIKQDVSKCPFSSCQL